MKRISLYFLLFFSFTLMAKAGPGDTIMIQTFEFEGYPVGEGWLSPREGFFDFSQIEGLDFAKIYMHYTLKCDPSQSPACGEWDYLSYIKVMEHTGIGYHPSYIIGGEGGISPTEISFMNETSWEYQSRFEDFITYDNPTAYASYLVGNGNIELSNPFNGQLSDSRNYYLFRAEELTAAGLSAGEISGMQFDVSSLGQLMKRLNIRIKHTTQEELGSRVIDQGFVNVFSKDFVFSASSWQQIDFTEFFNWDGVSNIIVDVYFDGEAAETSTIVKGDNYDWNCASSSTNTDNFLDFHGPDAIVLPVENLNNLEEEITISFWLKGNKEQPKNDMVFEAKDYQGHRLLNVHLPWSNERIYWDAGYAGYYDRIDYATDSVEQYKGQWNHWAFRKKTSLGKMSIFLNGDEWHSCTGKFALLQMVDSLVLGRNLGSNSSNFYEGKIDEFRIWGSALEPETIAQWMDKDIDASHPNYESLLAYYKFNETEGYYTTDEITGQSLLMKGVPQRLNFRGDRIKSFSVLSQRPNIKFIRHNSTYTLNTEMQVDSFALGEMLIDVYVQNNPGDEPILDETLAVFPSYYNNYVYDENGVAVDSSLVAPDQTLVLEMIEYNTSEPGVEILIPWEVGRFITPYGNNLSLDADGWTWVYDVSDFKHLFQGESVHMRAGNFQELLDLKMYFVEGTPAREVLDIKNLYSTNPQLSVFDEVVVDTVVDLLPEAKMFSLKTTLSGHWFGDGNNCAEFCPNIHSVDVNGNEEYSWQIIQECGENPLYPQGGTWFYDRAGWCPGMPVTQQNLDLTPYINIGVDEEVAVDYNVEYDPYGNYVTEIFFVSYDEPNFNNDAALEEIIAPSNFKLNGRFNPICGNPIIRIKNTGENNLTTLNIEYGVEGMETYSYSWQGNLAFLEEEVVSLPTISASDFYGADQNLFYVELSQPNGVNDEYIHNNINRSSFELAPSHDFQIVIWFKTNNVAWQNSYEVYDAQANVVFSKDDLEPNTVYIDTLNLYPGCYEFVAYDSEGDGMNNWPDGVGDGYIKIKKQDETLVANLEKWFGEYLRYNFLNTAEPVSVGEIALEQFNIWPNPSNGEFTIELPRKFDNCEVKVFNITGSIVYKTNIKNRGSSSLKLSHLPKGIYLIKVKSAGFDENKKIVIE